MRIFSIYKVIIWALLAVFPALFLQCAAQQPELECENLYCRASGTVGLQNLTYPYPVTSNADFDLVVTLTSRRGDVDLLVTPPLPEQERWSRMRAGDSRRDSVVIQRGDLQRAPGIYLITVVSDAQVVSDFSLAVQHATTAGASPELAAEDRGVLEEVMEECCAAEGSCPQLRAAAADRRFARFCDAVPSQCDDRGRLTHLSLMSEGLACPFPRALSRLASLSRLDLTFNKLDGSLERDVAAVVEVMPELQNLNLGYNQLQGMLSCRLLLADRQLAELDLADNQISGSIPGCLMEAPWLRQLYLAGNSLSGRFPPVPEGEGLSGELPSFAGVAALTVLRLGGNALTGSLPDLPVNVQEVRLQQNRFDGGIPDSYSGLVNLHTLKVEQNQLHGPIPQDLAALPMLEVLDVSENQLTGSLPAQWTTGKLVELDAHDNALTGPLPASLAQLPRLAYLQLQDNQLMGTLEAYVNALSAAESPSATRFLSLGGNRLSGGVPDGLSKLAAFQPGDWNILDGWMFEKTLNVSLNDLSGPLPVWAVQRFTADEGLSVKLAGNKWTCPEGRIGVAASVDSVALGDLFCSDTSGPSGATSRHSVIDMLTIDHSLDYSEPSTPNQATPHCTFCLSLFGAHNCMGGHYPQQATSASEVDSWRGDATSERHFQLKLPFQDLSEQQVWDAAWGDEDDVDRVPETPQQTDTGPLLRLPEEAELERVENAHEAHSATQLPDWAPGHHVSTPSRDADVDRHVSTQASWNRGPDRGFDLSITLPTYPINDVWEEHTEESTYSITDDSSDESTLAGVAAARPGNTGADQPQRKTTPPDAALSGSGSGAGGVRQPEGKGTEQRGEGHRWSNAGAIALALIVAVLAVALAGGLAYVGWREYKRTQGRRYSDLESCEEGLGQVEMQHADLAPSLGGEEGGDRGPLLGGPGPSAKAPVFHMHAVAGGLLPADIKVYRPPVLDDVSEKDTDIVSDRDTSAKAPFQ